MLNVRAAAAACQQEAARERRILARAPFLRGAHS
jgi:hypothetical protein